MAEILDVTGGWGGLALLLAITLAASLARGFSGFGAALIFVPMASAVLGPKLAAPILLVTDAIMTAWMIPPAFRRAERGQVAVMAAGAALGLPLGIWALTRLEPLTLRWAIAALVAAMLGLLASGWRYRGQPRGWLSMAVGLVSGLGSGAAQIGGPPVVAYWLGGAAQAAQVRANIVLFFAISTLMGGVGYLAGGLITGPSLALSALIAPVYGLGSWAGGRMFGLASEATFRRICLWMIGLAALTSLPVLDGMLRG